MTQFLTCGIVIYDEVDAIKKLLPRLVDEFKGLTIDWIFVLNHEQSEIRQSIINWLTENSLGHLTCYENPMNNLGFARHIILTQSRHELIYFTDPDVEIPSGSVRQLVFLAENHGALKIPQKIAGYGGLVEHRSTNLFLNQTFELLKKISRYFPFAFQVQSHPVMSAVDHLPTCHLLLKKSAAITIGGFSHLQRRRGEDTDFTHRAYNLNYRFLFLPSAQVLHWQNLSTLEWYIKIFNFGRTQIKVQKTNYRNGLRPYRLLPLAFLIATFLLISMMNPTLIFYVVATLVAIFTFNSAYLGFSMVLAAYSIGELSELVWPFFESENEEQLQELNANLTFQFYESSKNRPLEIET